jgi:hypothetical protein
MLMFHVKRRPYSPEYVAAPQAALLVDSGETSFPKHNPRLGLCFG